MTSLVFLSLSVSVLCGKRTGIGFLIFLSIIVIVSFLIASLASNFILGFIQSFISINFQSVIVFLLVFKEFILTLIKLFFITKFVLSKI